MRPTQPPRAKVDLVCQALGRRQGCDRCSAGRWARLPFMLLSRHLRWPEALGRETGSAPLGSRATSPFHSRGRRLLGVHLLKILSQRSSQTLRGFPSGRPARVAEGGREGRSGRQARKGKAGLRGLCCAGGFHRLSTSSQSPQTRQVDQGWEKGSSEVRTLARMGEGLPRTRKGPGHLPWRPDSRWSQWRPSSMCTESPSPLPLQGRCGQQTSLMPWAQASRRELQMPAGLPARGRGFPVPFPGGAPGPTRQ